MNTHMASNKITRKTLVSGLASNPRADDAVQRGLDKLAEVEHAGLTVSVSAKAAPVLDPEAMRAFVAAKVASARAAEAENIDGMTSIERLARRIFTDADRAARIDAAGDRARQRAEAQIGAERSTVIAAGVLLD